MDKPETRKQLNVKSTSSWAQCNEDIFTTFKADHATTVASDVPYLLENGVHVFVTTGEYDYSTNWFGQAAWVMHLDWSGRDSFLTSGYKSLIDKKYNEYGDMLEYKNLRFLKAAEVGAQLSADNPANSLFIFQSFLDWANDSSKFVTE